MNLSGKDKTIIIVLAAILVAVCYVELFLMPMLDKITLVSQDARDLSSQLDKITVTTAKYNSNKSKKDDLDSKVEKASEALPIIPKEPEVTYDVKNQADKSKVTLTTIAFSGTTDFDPNTITKPGEKAKIKNLKATQGKLMNLSANIVCSGKYSAILDFINNIESDKRIAEVQNINISSAGDDNLQVSMGINYYYLNKNDNSKVNYVFLQNSSAYGKSNMFSK